MKRIAMSLMDLVLSWKEKSIRTGYGHVIYFIWAVTFVTLCVFLLSTLALEWLLSNNVVSWHFVSEKKALYGAAGVNNFWSDFLIRFSDARLFHAMPRKLDLYPASDRNKGHSSTCLVLASHNSRSLLYIDKLLN